ncbi:hypothetical protein K491DRAFT_689032 [Lophiostoma macrostomum CBS 122681]|uniref:Zn(2)-C6 fungal-type domain-containing protein n=1 Tax=Lophiostoma macrostomum CBS 122681 TaxID=1314788 RepID=A0A6A6TI53_9PLEO|nr:hypothetical protein K491DRAFT_689032 [Lophiostoma macrostomum CBS 122681]
MARRSAGFISKKPHKKSRGGCLTCKKKKVKCDEASPRCSYCAVRKLDCVYSSDQSRSWQSHAPEHSQSSTPSNPSTNSPEDDVFDVPELLLSSELVPAVQTSSGHLSSTATQLLQFFQAETWRTLNVRESEDIHKINRFFLPHMGLSHSFLLNAILSVTAYHWNSLFPSEKSAQLSIMYRQKTFAEYNKALKDITNDNYEALLVTAVYLQILIPPPDPPCTNTEFLDWLCSHLHMMQGVRILAGLKWDSGIEKLTVFPMFKREVRALPPPPLIQSLPKEYLNPNPELANPLSSYNHSPSPSDSQPSTPPSSGMHIDLSTLPFRPKELPRVSASVPSAPDWSLPAPAFLPPALMALLASIADPSDTGPIDLHRSTLLPVVHALSPIFLSLYHYHLSQDVYLRIIVYPTFLPPEFNALMRAREPRALVIVAWWATLMGFPPNMWWPKGTVQRVLQAVSNIVMRNYSRVVMDALEGACRVARVLEREGREAGARSIFEGWDGVYWDMGGRGEASGAAGGQVFEDVEEGGCEAELECFG